MKLKLFISYARLDKEVVKPFVTALSEMYHCWVDWEDIAVGAFWEQEIWQGIAEADVFLFLLTENSAGSVWCNKELERAIAYGKRIIPILFASLPPANTPEVCKTLQHCSHLQIDALTSVLAHCASDVVPHTEVLLEAMKWQQRGKPARLLLKGDRLHRAVNWLKTSDDQLPTPTHLHREFILASQLGDRNSLAVIAIALIGIITITNAFLAFDHNLSYRNRRLCQGVMTLVGLVGVLTLGIKERASAP